MCGSKPLPDEVTKSIGIDGAVPPDAVNASIRLFADIIKTSFSGSKFEPLDAAAL